MPSPKPTGRTGPRKVVHVDMDAFYASIEQRDEPALRGRPVAVGGTRGRGVIAAASYEARAFGVRSAMPTRAAQRLCPELVLVPPRFELYRAVSRQIREIFAEYTSLIEPLSLDEAYLDVTENLKGIPLASRVATEIRAEILRRTGLTASAGVSCNKFLAKLASDQRKPNGQFVITPEMGPRFVETLDVAHFHGVGPVTAARMRQLGIQTGRDLRTCSLALLQQHFGKAGAHFHAIARGEDDRLVQPDRPRRSAGSETTFERDLSDPREVEARVEALADEVWEWCERTGSFGRTVTLKLRYADFRTITRSRTGAEPVNSRDTLAGTALALVRSSFPLAKPVRLLGITLSGFGVSGQGSEAQVALDFGQPTAALPDAGSHSAIGRR